MHVDGYDDGGDKRMYAVTEESPRWWEWDAAPSHPTVLLPIPPNCVFGSGRQHNNFVPRSACSASLVTLKL